MQSDNLVTQTTIVAPTVHAVVLKQRRIAHREVVQSSSARFLNVADRLSVRCSRRQPPACHRAFRKPRNRASKRSLPLTTLTYSLRENANTK